jgi:CBS domain containing-hemolysin-like protein
MEDVLEELVGEIRDEFDAEELNVMSRLGDDCWEVDADTLVLDFNRRSGWVVEAGKGERIGGLMYNSLGKTLRKGDVLETGNYRMQAVTLEAGALMRVRVTRIGAENSNAESASPNTEQT